MHASDAVDRPVAPYNTAYLRDDRSHLYDAYDVDPGADDGIVRPESGERDVPPDFDARRRAILTFYGRRCGRCLREVGVGVAGADGPEPGYVYAVAGAADGEAAGRGRWALERLVAVCEPCYELLSVADPDRLDAFGSAYRRSQQFPQWLGDPRVAVERLPLTGRELWLRERLAALVADGPSASADGSSVNAAAADRACFARPTPAATAIALGERLAADAWRPLPTEQRLTERWETLPDEERERYDRRARDRRALVEGSFVPARP